MFMGEKEMFLFIGGLRRDVARCDGAERRRVMRASRGQAASSV